jgi:hypothetical protein
MGIARIYALQGKKEDAKKLLENLKAQKTGNATWEMAIANLEGVVDRYEPHAARSLFDAADAAAKTIAAPTDAAGVQVPVAKPVTIPAPAAGKSNVLLRKTRKGCQDHGPGILFVFQETVPSIGQMLFIGQPCTHHILRFGSVHLDETHRTRFGTLGELRVDLGIAKPAAAASPRVAA